MKTFSTMKEAELAIGSFPSVDSYKKVKRIKENGGVSAEDVTVFQFTFYLIRGAIFTTLQGEMDVDKLPVDSLEFLGSQIEAIMYFNSNSKGVWYGTGKT